MQIIEEGNEKIEIKVLCLVVVSSVLIYFFQVCAYVNGKLNNKYENERNFNNDSKNNQVIQQKGKQQIQDTDSVLRFSIVQALSLRLQIKAKPQYCELIREKPSIFLRFHQLLWSSLISTVTCLIIPTLLFWKETRIMREALASVSKDFYSFLAVEESVSNYGLQKDLGQASIYQNDLSHLTTLRHVISNILFLAILIRQTRLVDKWAQSQRSQTQYNRLFKNLLFAIIITINPSFISLYILSCLQDLRLNKLSRLSLLPLLVPASVIYYYYESDCPYYQTLLFPTTFQPQANLMWIFYTHMFNRYLKMYQAIFLLLPVSTTIPLALLKINYQTKVLVQYFIVIFTSYHCTYFNLYLFWLIACLCLPNFSLYKKQLLVKTNKTLGYVAFIGSSFFFLSYQRLTQIYLNSWMVNIGYPFVFGCIAWTLIVIWLAQLIKIQLDQVGGIDYEENGSKQKGIFGKLKEKIIGLVKFKLWAKQPQTDKGNNIPLKEQKFQKAQ